MATHDFRYGLERELHILNMMLDASVDCIKLIDCDGHLLKLNRSGCEALGVQSDDIRPGMRWLDLLPADIRPRGRRALKIAREGRRASFAGRSELPGRKPIHWDNILTPVRAEDGRVAAILCLSRNVTRQREVERRLRIASEIDTLTGLPNRRLFRTHATRALKNGRTGLLLIDVDYFKEINDGFGHDAGDHILKTVSARFRAAIGAGQFIARLGGDEFAAVIDRIDSEAELSTLSARLFTALEAPIGFDGHDFAVSISVGGAISSLGQDGLPDLLKASDAALYAAKNAGRNGFSLHRAA